TEWNPRMRLAGTGMALGSYGYAVFMGAAVYRREDHSALSEMYIPIVRPWLALRKKARFDVASTASGRLVDLSLNHCHGDLCALPFMGGILLFIPEVVVLVIDPIA